MHRCSFQKKNLPKEAKKNKAATRGSEIQPGRGISALCGITKRLILRSSRTVRRKNDSSDGWRDFCFRWSAGSVRRCCQPLPTAVFLGKRLESRSTTGCGHINFWFDLTQADVIQPESVPHDATWGFVFVRLLRLAKRINKEKKTKTLASSLKILTIHNHNEPGCAFIFYHQHSLEHDLHFTFNSEEQRRPPRLASNAERLNWI